MHTTLKNKTALVTGVSSGIGREIAQLLAERGARVFGTARNPKSASPIPGVEIIGMDVTDDASVARAIQSIEQKAGPVQLLVNNAGYSVTGALEETSVEEAKEQFETNFFGVLRVTSAVLRKMRQDGYGRIVNISSALGFLPAPYWGMYAASKHALEGYTETLDHEVRRFSVRAVLIEPAYTKTKINAHAKPVRVALEVYAAERKRMTEFAERETERGDDPRIVAEAVCNAVTVKSPRLRYPVGKGVSLMVGLTSWQALKERAQLKPGQKVFIPAGSGGIGTFAMQLAKRLGAKVGTTTSTGNVELVHSLGADEVIDYKQQEFDAVLQNYDAVLGTVQGDAIEKSLRISSSRGR